MATAKEIEDGKIFAFLGVFLHVIGFVIVLLTKKENEYAMFYAKQGLALFIVGFVGGLVIAFFGLIPILGWIFGALLSWLWMVFMFVLWVIGWVGALSGKEKAIPVVGGLAKKLNF